MKEQITPYLSFDGNAKQALEFYKEVLGAEVTGVQTFGEADYPTPPEANDRVMHAQLKKGNISLMFSDTFPGQSTVVGNNITLTLEPESDEEIQHLYDALRKNGKPLNELEDTFWGAKYARVQDQFGIIWELNYQKS
ncbi:VOC family protein [Neobacillus sp. 179-C4.2 HS]|uniref:VOC family protein n=1 Tax=Neobacillus driksii TaxID=3035913 RepID=A0ABV4YRM1_9BACI|nr:VOC family protein [Neobacillus sp. 179.-C4.2 HS]MDP5197040.1 VOC family protein [Neobacillus sp. 179.-C4.2 HS]